MVIQGFPPNGPGSIFFFVLSNLGFIPTYRTRLRDDTPDNISMPVNVVRLFIHGTPFNVLVRLIMLIYDTIYIFSHSNTSFYKPLQM